MSGASESSAEAAERALMNGLFSDVGRTDPHAVLRSSPVPGCRYQFVRGALHDPRFIATSIPPSPDLMFQVVARFMARLPPERHRRVRAHFSGLFTPRRAERYRERITQRAHLLIDALPAEGPVDLVAAFTRPLPFSVIADVLGVRAERHSWLSAAMETFGRGIAGQRDHANVELGNAATAEMLDYFDHELQQRADHPSDDVLTLLAADTATGEDRADLLANCIFLILAGHATTTTLLAAGTQLLSEHPDQLNQVIADPGLWPGVVEELLRYISPTTLTGVTAREATEVAGCLVPAGARRALVFAAANRDPSIFTDPDSFDITRTHNPHLAFSAGAHFCLGAPLARMHAESALPALFERLPGLRVTEPPEWAGSTPIRQISTLTVHWN